MTDQDKEHYKQLLTQTLDQLSDALRRLEDGTVYTASAASQTAVTLLPLFGGYVKYVCGDLV